MLFGTTAFEQLARVQSAALGLPELPLLLLPHPLGGTAPEAATAKAQSAWPELEEWLKQVTAPPE
jgi:predicted dienelactone hydrolase